MQRIFMLKCIIFLILLLSCNQAIARNKCSFSFDTSCIAEYGASKDSKIECSRVTSDFARIEYVPLDNYSILTMNIVCINDNITCEENVAEYISGGVDVIEKTADNIFIPRKNDKTLYKYSNDLFTVYFSSIDVVGYSDENLIHYGATVINKNSCNNAIYIGIGAEKKLVYKNERKILHTINSIRFIDN